jgi:hypothetical protein
VAQVAGQAAHLEVFGSQMGGSSNREQEGSRPMRSRSPRRSRYN